jgi:hypothetical protein
MPVPDPTLEGIYTKKAARQINKDSGEIWIFEHRGMSVWYNGVTPKNNFCIQGRQSMWYMEEEKNSMKKDDVIYESNFELDDRLKPQDGIKISNILLKEIVIFGYRELDPDYPYLDEIDLGKKGYVITDNGRFECSLVGIFYLDGDAPDAMKYRWIDEITGLYRFKPDWSKKI